MKKTLAILLTLILTFSSVSILGTVSAEELPTTNVVFTDFTDFSDTSNWLYGRASFVDENSDGVKDFVRLNTTADKKTAYIASKTFTLVPGTEYELSCYVRVPSTSANYVDGTTKQAPRFIIYQTDAEANGKPTSSYLEGQNDYAYKGNGTTTALRRTAFTADWKIGKLDSITSPRFSSFSDNTFKSKYPDLNPTDVYSDWTKVTATFTAIDDENNVGPQTVSLRIDLKKNTIANAQLDIKDLTLIDKSIVVPEVLPEGVIVDENFEELEDVTEVIKDGSNVNWEKIEVTDTEAANGEKSASVFAPYVNLYIPLDKSLLKANTEYKFSMNWKMVEYTETTANTLRNLKLVGWNPSQGQALKDATEIAKHANVNATGQWINTTFNFTISDLAAYEEFVISFQYKASPDENGSYNGTEDTLFIDDIKVIDAAKEEIEVSNVPRGPEVEEGFEKIAVGTKLYDHTLTGTQNMYTYSAKGVLLTSFGSLSVVEGGANGSLKSLKGSTYYQYVAMPLALDKNTEYELSFWYKYTTKDSNLKGKDENGKEVVVGSAKAEDIFLEHITYGIFIPDATNKTMQVAPGGGTRDMEEVFAPGEFESGEWRKSTLKFSTGDNVDNLVFGYTYADKYKDDLSLTVNSTPLYIDDVKIKKTQNVTRSQINVDATTSVSVDFIGTNRFDYYVGETVEFKVVTAKGLTPTVYLSSSEITPDENGVYSFTAEKLQKITVQCSGDTATRQNNRDKNGYSLDIFNETLAAKPVWEGNTVYHENVLFIPGRETAKLIYPISEIISVRSYDLYTNYIKGVDYDVTEDGQLKILEGSRIPVYTKPLETNSPSNNLGQGFPIVGKENTYAAFIGDYTYPAYAISVTYEHTDLWEDGYNPYVIESAKKSIPKVFEKLENGEDVNVVIFGDSASCGWSTSGLNYVKGIYAADGTLVDNVLNFAPYTLPWPSLLENELKKLYPDANITFKNLALGGKNAEWGYKNIVKRLGYLGADWDTDLMILAYGGNDLTAGHTPETFKSNMQAIIDTVRLDTTNGAGPDTEVLLWSQYICNTDVEQYTLDKHMAYRDVYIELASGNEGVGLSDSLGEFAEILKSKEIVDIFNTNVNHGNDFLTRVIAQCLIASLSQPEYLAGDVDDNETSNLKDLVSLAQYVAKWENLNINEYALDINGDKAVDLNDVQTLAKHLAGWSEIELTGTYTEYNTVSLSMTDAVEKMKLSNRTVMNDENLLQLGWAYSGFTVQGHFSGEFAINNVKLDRANLVYAVLDGDLENANQVVIKKNVDKVVLLGNIDPGFHTIQLIKASEGYYSADSIRYKNNITIGGITYNGTLFSAPAEKERKIEFIGDSITSSMGLYTEEQEPNWVLRTDFTKGYAVQVADYFDADLGVVACSNGSICSEAPYMYDQYQNLYFDGPDYDFASRTEPDIVVINLAANDIPAYFLEGTTNKLDPEKTDVLAKGVQDMLTMVRSHNPNAKILWVCGMVEVRCVNFIKEQVEAFAETDGNTMYTFVNRHDCSGQGGHPTPQGHTDNAEELIEFIESKIWTK